MALTRGGLADHRGAAAGVQRLRAVPDQRWVRSYPVQIAGGEISGVRHGDHRQQGLHRGRDAGAPPNPRPGQVVR